MGTPAKPVRAFMREFLTLARLGRERGVAPRSRGEQDVREQRHAQLAVAGGTLASGTHVISVAVSSSGESRVRL